MNQKPAQMLTKCPNVALVLSVNFDHMCQFKTVFLVNLKKGPVCTRVLIDDKIYFATTCDGDQLLRL
jgi:hypothetical protein